MFQHEGGTTVVQKRMGFLSVAVMSISGILITVIACASGVAIYGLRIVDRKTDSALSFVQELARQLPEIQKSLPPVLADAINDERQPDYLPNLAVSVRMIEPSSRGWDQGVVEVTNKGDKIVSMLSLRVIGLNENGDPVIEENTWAATPIQADNDWRGPILPNETRRFPVHFYSRNTLKNAKCEVTDIRIWRGQKEEQVARASDESR